MPARIRPDQHMGEPPSSSEAAMSIADNPVFQDAEAAREFLESLLWPDGHSCRGLAIGSCRRLDH
jgi:hypothetical protein